MKEDCVSRDLKEARFEVLCHMLRLDLSLVLSVTDKDLVGEIWENRDQKNEHVAGLGRDEMRQEFGYIEIVIERYFCGFQGG